MDTTEQASISLPRESWLWVRTAVLQYALQKGRQGRAGDAKKLLEIASEIATAGGSDLLDAAELGVRESLGVELVT